MPAWKSGGRLIPCYTETDKAVGDKYLLGLSDPEYASKSTPLPNLESKLRLNNKL